MSSNDLNGFTSEEWRRVVRVFQRVLAPGEVAASAKALVNSLAQEFNLGAVQVWLRAGELDLAGLALTHLAEHLELVALDQPPSRPAPPSRIGIRDSLSGFVATEGVPYRWCARYTPTSEWEDARWAEKAGYSVGLAVPLIVQGRPIGSLTIWELGETPAFPEGLALLVAEHASLALTQIRRLHGMRRQVQWLTGLQQVTGLLASRLSPDELYRLIFEQVARILSIDGFSINLYDEGTDRIERALIVEGAEGHYRFLPREPWRPLEGTIWERIVKTREPILINRSVRSAASEAKPGGDGESGGQSPPPASIMYAPMMAGEHVIGVMSAQSHTPSAYDQETLDLLTSVANQAALAIENARLLDQLNRQIQETQQANQLKSQFIANISHEVRTPLNTIMGFTRMVRRRAGSLLPEQHVRNLDSVLESADHLLRLISDLLDLSRLEAGRLQILSEPVDLRRLIVRTLGDLEPLMEEASTEIDLDIDPSLGLVHTDPTRVRQVVVNLVSNAFKFANEGLITIRAGRLNSLAPDDEEWQVADSATQLTWSPPSVPLRSYENRETPTAADRYFYVEVADEGPGMDPRQVAQVFQEFRQASSGDNRSHTGTGLGLTIVRRIAERMKGDVWVRTRLGEGSTFRVVLAESQPPPSPPPTPTIRAIHSPGSEKHSPHPLG